MSIRLEWEMFIFGELANAFECVGKCLSTFSHCSMQMEASRKLTANGYFRVNRLDMEPFAWRIVTYLVGTCFFSLDSLLSALDMPMTAECSENVISFLVRHY